MFYEAKCVLCYVCNIYKTKTATRKNSNYYHLHFNVYHFISVTYCLPNFLFLFRFDAIAWSTLKTCIMWIEVRIHNSMTRHAARCGCDWCCRAAADDDVNEELNQLFFAPKHYTSACYCCCFLLLYLK